MDPPPALVGRPGGGEMGMGLPSGLPPSQAGVGSVAQRPPLPGLPGWAPAASLARGQGGKVGPWGKRRGVCGEGHGPLVHPPPFSGTIDPGKQEFFNSSFASDTNSHCSFDS